MKEYIKNKNFIPYYIYKQSKQNNSKVEIRIIIMFMLVNVLLLSLNIKENKKIKISQNDTLHKSSVEQVNTINYLNIIKNCEILLDDDISSVTIDNGEGNIVIDNLDKIKEIEQNKEINLKGINFDSENKSYKVSLKINE